MLSWWRIVVTPRAEKDLKGVPSRDQMRIRRILDMLTQEPGSVDQERPPQAPDFSHGDKAAGSMIR